MVCWSFIGFNNVKVFNFRVVPMLNCPKVESSVNKNVFDMEIAEFYLSPCCACRMCYFETEAKAERKLTA